MALEEVSLGKLLDIGVRMTIAASFVQSFNAVMLRAYSQMFIDKCERCRGKGVTKCPHCKGYGLVRTWPAVYDVANTKDGNGRFEKRQSYYMPCPTCRGERHPGNSDYPSSADLLWQDRELARDVDISLVLARRGEEGRKKPNKALTGTIRCPDCHGNTTTLRLTPNLNRVLNRERRKAYHWMRKTFRAPLAPGTSYYGNEGRSNVETDVYGQWLDQKFSEYNAPIGSKDWDVKAMGVISARREREQRFIDQKIANKIKDGSMRLDQITYQMSPTFWEKAETMGVARPKEPRFDYDKYLAWRYAKKVSKTENNYMAEQQAINRKNRKTRKINKQSKAGSKAAVAAKEAAEKEDAAASNKLVDERPTEINTGFSIGKKGSDAMQM